MGTAQAIIPVGCSTYPETEMSRTFPALNTALIAVGLLFATSSLAALCAPPPPRHGPPHERRPDSPREGKPSHRW